jgi:hypothetical protein
LAKVLTAENSANCADATLYLGAIVNGVEPDVPIGPYRFPDHDELIALDAPAKAALAVLVFREPSLFGRWRD